MTKRLADSTDSPRPYKDCDRIFESIDQKLDFDRELIRGAGGGEGVKRWMEARPPLVGTLMSS